MFSRISSFVGRHVRKYGPRGYARYSSNTFTDNEKQCQPEVSPATYCHACGQPTAETHPHLLNAGEVVPGIQLDEFITRRNKLMEKVVARGKTESNKSHIVIIPSSSKVYMSGKIPYVFRQNTDFLYFSGCQEPDTVLVLTAKNGQFSSILFLRHSDENSKLWEGPRTVIEDAPKLFGVDSALPMKEVEKFIFSFLNENSTCSIWYETSNVVQPALHTKLIEILKNTGLQSPLLSPTSIMHKIRLIKSQSEINLMKKSCDIACAAISKTIETSRPGMTEHQLFATVDYECRMHGAEFLAYPPVVASGKNANIIHYINNNQMIRDGDMVLMDAGCEYHGYSSDITRTWPVNGKFTQEQKLLYNIILEVQNILISRLKEMPTLDQLFFEMCHLLGRRLQKIGLIPENISNKELSGMAFAYCPHHISHYLGMDVHDTGEMRRSMTLQPGMIITVEPGIYVNAKHFAPPEFHGLGIRIEDDILITESGPVILTGNCPKEAEEIESLASRNT